MPEMLRMSPARCAEKTASGNAYERRDDARDAALRLREKTGDPVEHFRCGHCERWHIGKPPVKADKSEAADMLVEGPWDITTDAYYADCSHVSNSMKEDFRESRPLYHQRYVERTLPRKEPTDAMILGTAMHVLLMEPDRYASAVAVLPKVNGRTNAVKAEMASFVANAGNGTLITADQSEQLQRMADGVRRNSLARDLLEAPGRNELVIRWTDPTYGLDCKSKLDRVLDAGLIVDLKTTANPNPHVWARKAADYGYHRQAAFYLHGAAQAMNVQAEFLHILIGKEPPYECAVVELDAVALDLGSDQNHRLLGQLTACYDGGSWTSIWNDEIFRLSLPKWAFYENAT